MYNSSRFSRGPPPTSVGYRSVTYNEDKNIVVDGETYLFFRLYDSQYVNTLDLHNILKGFIVLGDVNDITVNHVSFGFSLEDEFWGLSVEKGDGINKYLNKENCLNLETNPYMIKCDPDKSIQTTYALKVKKEEFDKALQLTEKYVNDESMVYSKMDFVKIGGNEVIRRLFYSEKQQDIQSMERKKNSFINNPNEKKFHCASFISYILINSVDNIYKFFEEKGLDYDKIAPSDISRLPGVKKIFSSSWSDYDAAAQQFMEFYKKLL